MALITCPACGKQISNRAVSCPHCGEPIQSQEPMMEYQQQEPVQQYNESGNNSRKYVVPLAIVAGVLLTVLVGVIAYNKGAKNMDVTTTKSDSEFYMAVDTLSGDEHECVDLGLPSGTLWATTNVGGSSPEDYGNYYAWGETTPKDVYNSSTYKWCNGAYNKQTKYCTRSDHGNNGFIDNKTELEPEDDAATANWGPRWCMPTKEQIRELLDNCRKQWTTRNGVSGRLFTSKHNGASLFLPAAGNRVGDELDYAGSCGCYWSRTLHSAYNHLYFDSNYVHWGDYDRHDGMSVRAVRVSQK